MKLYHYDHCPYCVKARMIFGLKSVPVEVIPLANDDEATPIGLVGQKMVPILVREDGRAMPESLDIIRYIDGLAKYGPPLVAPSRKKPELEEWLQKMRTYHYKLAMPRWPQMDLPEFQTPEAIAYFTKKKTEYTGPFAEALKESPQLMEVAQKELADLERLMGYTDWFWGEPTMDDFHVFANLRILTVVKGLEFPQKVNSYMNGLAQRSKVPLHWEQAL